MKTLECIQNSKGFVEVIVDDEDFHLIEGKKLRVRQTGHVYMNGRGALSLAATIIGPANRGFVIDHINRNPLDNRRCNLRIVSSSINAQNRSLSSKNTTGYKGVSIREDGTFRALLQLNTGAISSSGHKTAELAAAAYDRMVEIHAPNGTTNKSLKLYGTD